jgi:hypothetical protein
MRCHFLNLKLSEFLTLLRELQEISDAIIWLVRSSYFTSPSDMTVLQFKSAFWHREPAKTMFSIFYHFQCKFCSGKEKNQKIHSYKWLAVVMGNCMVSIEVHTNDIYGVLITLLFLSGARSCRTTSLVTGYSWSEFLQNLLDEISKSTK